MVTMTVDRLASTLALERYGSRVLAQHIDDGEYVVVASVKARVRVHLNDISLP